MVAGSDFAAAAGQNQARLAPPEDLAGLYDSIMTAAPLADEMAPALGMIYCCWRGMGALYAAGLMRPLMNCVCCVTKAGG